MEQINNFKRLELENIEKYQAPRADIHKNLNRSVGQFQFFAQIADLFFTKLIGTSLGGINIGSISKTSAKATDYPNTVD